MRDRGGVCFGVPWAFFLLSFHAETKALTALPGHVARRIPPFRGKGVAQTLILKREKRAMGKRKLTPAESRAYAELAEAARRLRVAQERAERRRKKRKAVPHAE